MHCLLTLVFAPEDRRLQSPGGIQWTLAVRGQHFRSVWTCYKWGTGAGPWWQCMHGRSAAAHSPHRWSASDARPGLPRAGSLLRRWSGERVRETEEGRHDWGSGPKERQCVGDKLWASLIPSHVVLWPLNTPATHSEMIWESWSCLSFSDMKKKILCYRQVFIYLSVKLLGQVQRTVIFWAGIK